MWSPLNICLMLKDFRTAASRGVARIFQRGGGVTLCQNKGTQQIVISFLPPVVSCLLKNGLKSRGGGSQAPQEPPSYAPCCKIHIYACAHEARCSFGVGWGGLGIRVSVQTHLVVMKT